MDSEKIEVHITRCRSNAHLPFYAKPGDAGMDLVAAEETLLAPGETKLVPTGLKVAIPEGFEIQVRPRSGLSLHTPLRIPNSPGTIDAGFRDEICIIVTNTSTLFQKSAPDSSDSPASCDTPTNSDSPASCDTPTNSISSTSCDIPPSSISSVFSDAPTYSISEKGCKPGNYRILPGDRIAQIVLQRVPRIQWNEQDSVTDIGSDRGGGFGSTGSSQET